MPRSIPIPPQTRVIDGVVVSRGELVRGTRTERVDGDIRRWAKRRVAESQRAMEKERARAMHAGYRDGMAVALEDVVAHLMRTEQMCLRWRGEMIEQVRGLLTCASRHPEALLCALDDALRAFAGVPSDVPVTIVLPVRLKARRDGIRARVEAACEAPLKLEFRTTDERISVHRGSTVIEYDPDDYVARAGAALDIDPNASKADLHAMLAPALRSLGERVAALAKDQAQTEWIANVDLDFDAARGPAIASAAGRFATTGDDDEHH
ncbi:Oxygen-regulated invasion protein OrgB [Pandoraea anapnoica]|uniref:Oxygen-regulated invasion protein OrgB n=1 Tax=Pandoraea anapnoica TaxID=2508301 RepID=A0A5E5A9M9_9BURK|nr:Oxygen-regulated invasion protein OrgB [Pandoraea anapnoica]